MRIPVCVVELKEVARGKTVAEVGLLVEQYFAAQIFSIEKEEWLKMNGSERLAFVSRLMEVANGKRKR
jgi:hypothetical protein